MHPTWEQIAKFSAKLVGSLTLSSIRRFRGLYPVLGCMEEASRVSESTRPMENVTQPWKCKLLVTSRSYRSRSIRNAREKVSAKDSGRGFNGQFSHSKHSKIVNHRRFEVSCGDLQSDPSNFFSIPCFRVWIVHFFFTRNLYASGPFIYGRSEVLFLEINWLINGNRRSTSYFSKSKIDEKNDCPFSYDRIEQNCGLYRNIFS